MNTFTTVYDLSTEPYDWVWTAFCFVLLVIALIIYLYVPNWPYRRNLLQVSLLLILLTGLAPYMYDRWLFHKQTSGSCPIVVGVVANYWSRREYRLKEDSRGRTVKSWSEYEGFRVNDVPFTYTVNASAPYFHNGTKVRLPIYDGMAVRISYFPELDIGGSPVNRILKLEIQPSSS